ncbi:MAG TPA: Crp/Fnr family transcriptional regulator [Bacteroidia bacterium]|nr:Crp/Fnr family transcriptional regulator [Bacteroidia bacterium]
MLSDNYRHNDLKYIESIFLKNYILKDYFTQQQKQEAAENMRSETYKKEEVIFHEGQPSFLIYFIGSGIVKLWKEGIHHVEQTIRFAKEGDMFGFWGSLENNSYSLSATALTDVQLCYVKKDLFLPMVQDNFSLEVILHDYIKELKKTEDDLRNMAEMNVREKAAHSILVLLDVFRNCMDEHAYKTILSRKEIAALSAISEDRVSKQLSEFKRENIIKISDDKIFIDEKALHKIINAYPWYNPSAMAFSFK